MNADDEWKALAEAGARRKRKAMIPAIVGIALFFLTTLGTFLALGSWAGERAIAREKALHDRGLVEVTYSTRGRTVTKAEQTRDAGAFLFLVAVAAGVVAGGVGFFATGGRPSAEHLRGVQGMTRG